MTPLLGLALLALGAASAHAEDVWAVTTANSLIRFDSGAPGTINALVPISGLQSGESILAIDFRPVTGQLYGLGSTSRLYVLSTTTGIATQVGSGPFTPALSGTDFGFDFNPFNDRIRMVGDADQNLSIDPNTAVVTTQAALNPGNPNVVGAAYTNNYAGATATTLYVIDSSTDSLLILNPPANGTLTTVGPLGVNTSGLVGFDIAPPTNKAYAAMTQPASSASSLYQLNLTTGAASLVGTIGGGVTVRGIALPTFNPTIYAVTSANHLLRFSSATPGTLLGDAQITGLQAGETVLGIDFRPATGQLYGLASTSRLYTIDTTSGAATQVGSAGAFTLNGTSFGFDFNPFNDRIRVVSNSEQNLRLNPNDGTLAAADTALSYAAGDAHAGANPSIVGSAYSNNVPGAASTTLFGIDSTFDTLVIQNPPNGGALNTARALGMNTSDLVGFDIATANGQGYAVLTIGGAPQLFTIALPAGPATLVGTVGGSPTVQGMAVAMPGQLAFSQIGYTVSESAGAATITVIRTGGSDGPVTVNYAASNGTATAGQDYTATSGTLVFLHGETTKTFSVPILEDAVLEGDETLSLALSNPTNGATLAGPSAAVLTILDNESPPTATATPTPTRTPTPTATPFPRPNVAVAVTPTAGTLTTTITARDAACSGGNNQLQSLQFTRLANATVDVATSPATTVSAMPTTVSLPAHPASIVLTVHRVTAGVAATVELTVSDGCGSWPTFIGGGPSAF
jgi:hypothetical protein